MEAGRTGGAAASAGEAQRTTRYWDEKTGRPAEQASETGEDANYYSRTAATFCGECLALTLGAATTLSLALLQGGAVLADVCWRAIRKSCCDTATENVLRLPLRGSVRAGDLLHYLRTQAFHARMRLTTSLPKKFDTSIKSPCVSTCRVHPAATTAAHPTLSSPLLVCPICSDEGGARSICGTSRYRGVLEATDAKRTHAHLELMRLEATDVKRTHAHLELMRLRLPAARAWALGAACALRRQENWVTTVRRTDTHESSPLRAWRTHPNNVHHKAETYARNTLQAGHNELKSVQFTTGDRSHAVSTMSHGRLSVSCYADTQLHRGKCREQRQLSCCERSLSRKDNSNNRSRHAAAADAAAASPCRGDLCNSGHSRQAELRGVISSAAVKDSRVRGAGAAPDRRTENATSGIGAAAAAGTTGEERMCMSNSKEEVARTAVVCKRWAATAAGDATSREASTTKKAVASEKLLGQTTAVAKAVLQGRQSRPAAAGADVSSGGDYLNLTAEQLQHTAEQVSLKNRSTGSTGSTASKELHAAEDSCQEETAAVGCDDLPWGNILCLVQRWHQTLTSYPEFVLLKFTHFPLPQSSKCSTKGYYWDRFSNETGEAAEEVIGETTGKEGSDDATRGAEVAAIADTARETSTSKRRTAAITALEAGAGTDKNAEERHRSVTEYEKRICLNHRCMGKSLNLAVPCVPEQLETPQPLSFYPPLFTSKDLMSFRLPWHELRNDVCCPFFGAKVQREGSTPEARTGTGSEIEKPSFWGRYFCLRSFSPIAKSRAELEQRGTNY